MLGDPINLFHEKPHDQLDKYFELHCTEHGRIAIMQRDNDSAIAQEKFTHILDKHAQLSERKYKHEGVDNCR